jgi:hypothetical protein
MATLNTDPDIELHLNYHMRKCGEEALGNLASIQATGSSKASIVPKSLLKGSAFTEEHSGSASTPYTEGDLTASAASAISSKHGTLAKTWELPAFPILIQVLERLQNYLMNASAARLRDSVRLG